MDYEKLKKPANVSKDNNKRSVATNASIPEIARAQKEQGIYIHQNNQNKDDELEVQSSNNEKVATLSLNIFTETFNRSDITRDELKDAQVGHTWISLKYNDPKLTPKSLGHPTYDLVQHGVLAA